LLEGTVSTEQDSKTEKKNINNRMKFFLKIISNSSGKFIDKGYS